MQLIGDFTVADIFLSPKSGRTTLTLIPDNGGLMRLSVEGEVANLKARDDLHIDTILKVRNYASGGIAYEIDPASIKKMKSQ